MWCHTSFSLFIKVLVSSSSVVFLICLPSTCLNLPLLLNHSLLLLWLYSWVSCQSFKQQVPFQREECVITFLKQFFNLHTSQFNWALYQHLLWALVCLSVPAPSHHFGICSGLEYCLSSTGFSLLFEITDCSSKQLTGYLYGYNTVGPHWC